MKPLALLLALFALTGCATPGNGKLDLLDNLKEVALTDAQYASELAATATDPGAPYRKECWDAIAFYLAVHSSVETLFPLEPKGVLSGVEIGFETVHKVKGVGDDPLGAREKVQAKCAYVVRELERAAIRVGGKVAPFPGAGAAGKILGR